MLELLCICIYSLYLSIRTWEYFRSAYVHRRSVLVPAGSGRYIVVSIYSEQWFHKTRGWSLLLFQVVREFLYHATVVRRWYACSWVQHEGDCESQGQVGGRILNEVLWRKFLEWESTEKEKRLLKVSQAEYVKEFNMADAKSVNVLLGGHFKLSEA